MGKSTHFIGQPILGQLISFLDKSKVLGISRLHGGECYVKTFGAWSHLVVMLYAVMMRFDSMREITSAMMMECRELELLQSGHDGQNHGDVLHRHRQLPRQPRKGLGKTARKGLA